MLSLTLRCPRSPPPPPPPRRSPKSPLVSWALRASNTRLPSKRLPRFSLSVNNTPTFDACHHKKKSDKWSRKALVSFHTRALRKGSLRSANSHRKQPAARGGGGEVPHPPREDPERAPPHKRGGVHPHHPQFPEAACSTTDVTPGGHGQGSPRG